MSKWVCGVWELVEKFPREAVEEAELLRGIVGNDAVGVLLDESVEVAGLDIDGGALDLQVEEGIDPKVVAHLLFVLTIEYAQVGVVGISIEAGMVAKVESYLYPKGIVEEFEVGVEGVFAGEERDADLVLVAAELDMLLHIVVEPAEEF